MRLYPANSLTGAPPSGWCLRELFTFIMPWRIRAQCATQAQQREMIELLRNTADILEAFSPPPETPEQYMERLTKAAESKVAEPQEVAP